MNETPYNQEELALNARLIAVEAIDNALDKEWEKVEALLLEFREALAKIHGE